MTTLFTIVVLFCFCESLYSLYERMRNHKDLRDKRVVEEDKPKDFHKGRIFQDMDIR